MKNARVLLLLLLIGITLIMVAAPLLQHDPAVIHNEASSREVLVINLTGSVDPGTYSMVKADLAGLSNSSVRAVIININAGSGMLNSALEIDKCINSTENSGIKVYAYIGPDASAVNAGSYVAMDTDGIYMAKGSSIGRARPYIIGGSQGEENSDTLRMGNTMSALASSHGRNGTYAMEMVTDNTVYDSSAALADNVANGKSQSLSGFIAEMGLSSYSIHYREESVYENFLGFLGSPFTAGLLILTGIIAVFFDLYHGTVVLSVLGVALIILGIVGAALIDASIIGLILLLLAGILIFVEFETNHGVALLLGLISGIAGVYFLGSSYGTNNPGYSPDPYGEGFYLTSIAIILLGILMVVYISRILKSQIREHYTGIESLIGHSAEVKTDMGTDGKGFVAIEGVQWRALNIGVPVNRNDRVIIIERRGLTLIVKKI
ncbi:NfeD family protein [Ferroplasma sp.]|uniref:NfeD family protein n=1 Tax=Ferroplasma sp. TaxID=2591003 RepID=UPI002632D1B6|nr:NfeD family protein [Ferroplasma sp.]MCL4452564.1 nodulation protein NfeD [Candidatus Thermoplasmatota archaeon]